MSITLKNVRPFCSGKLLAMTNITINDNNIIEIIGQPTQGQVIDCKGNICCAGFVDLHTHGGGGQDCMQATPESLKIIADYHLSCGITSFVPTTMTASIADTRAAIDNIRAYNSSGAKILGVHLEGPYLSQNNAGAHPQHLLLPPIGDNCDFVWDNQDIISRITLAPNLDGAAEFCKKACDNNIQVSLGHDNSIDDEIYACIQNGATSVTHLYNCTSRPSRRLTPKKHLGLTEIALISPQLICEVIADDRHVPNDLFDMIFKLKGSDKICFVSDSLSVAGMPDGDYYIGSGDSKQKIKIDDNVAVLPDLNTYAGSVTPISKMVENAYARGYSAEDCLKMATLTPAKLIKNTQVGDIQIGMCGNVNLLDSNLKVVQTLFDQKFIK